MNGRYGVLNVLLFFIVLILGYENYGIWSPSGQLVGKKEGGRKMEGKADFPSVAALFDEVASREAVNVIAEKNLFSPERREFSSQAAASMGSPITRPQITLTGVAMGEDYQIATIINPGRPLYKGERETKCIKVGEMVGGYKLTKILPDRIVMEGGEDSFEVLLYDPRFPKKRLQVRTPAKPSAVASPRPGSPAPTPSTHSPVVSPSPRASMPPLPRPTSRTPLPIPRSPEAAPRGAYQSPGSPTSPSNSPPVADPGLWRGRRPVAPTGPPG